MKGLVQVFQGKDEKQKRSEEKGGVESDIQLLSLRRCGYAQFKSLQETKTRSSGRKWNGGDAGVENFTLSRDTNSYKDRNKGNHGGEARRMNIIRYEVVKFKFKFPGTILERWS